MKKRAKIEKILTRMLNRGILQIIGPNNPKGWMLSAGGWSPLYINLRELLFDIDLFKECLSLLPVRDLKIWFSNFDKIVLVGVPTMGTPIATYLAFRHDHRLGIIRQRFKEHGMGQAVEGVQSADKVILIDDVYTTGNSLRAAQKLINENTGALVVDKMVIIDRGSKYLDEKVLSAITIDTIVDWIYFRTDINRDIKRCLYDYRSFPGLFKSADDWKEYLYQHVG